MYGRNIRTYDFSRKCMLIISKRIRDSITYNFDNCINISFVIFSLNYLYVLNIY